MTITIRLQTELEQRLRKRLEAGGEALSQFVRNAIEEKLSREAVEHPTAYELGKHLFGKSTSGVNDLGSAHAKHFREKVRARNRD
jgi:hypothetical protein